MKLCDKCGTYHSHVCLGVGVSADTLWDAAARECGTEIVPGYEQPVIVLQNPQALAELLAAMGR